jgi:hypothetical protein
MTSEEIVGLGVRALEKINASYENIWTMILDKVYHPEKYLPMTNVKIEDRAPNHVYREMSSKETVVLREDIYLDKENGEARFVVQDMDEVHVNKFHKEPDKQYLEYWAENKQGQRISWNVPKAWALKAMQVIKEKAEQSP